VLPGPGGGRVANADRLATPKSPHRIGHDPVGRPSEFLSSLPPWRRLLARLTWHPTLDGQINAIGSRQESERLRSDTALLTIENARLAALESRLDSLLLSADSSSPISPATDCN
jgi:hypothetical protein